MELQKGEGTKVKYLAIFGSYSIITVISCFSETEANATGTITWAAEVSWLGSIFCCSTSHRDHSLLGLL